MPEMDHLVRFRAYFFFFFTVSFTSSISRILICEIMDEWFNERKNTAVYKVLVDYNICVCVCPIC